MGGISTTTQLTAGPRNMQLYPVTIAIPAHTSKGATQHDPKFTKYQHTCSSSCTTNSSSHPNTYLPNQAPPQISTNCRLGHPHGQASHQGRPCTQHTQSSPASHNHPGSHPCLHEHITHVATSPPGAPHQQTQHVAFSPSKYSTHSLT
jgi:hypothetical protein